MTATSLEVRPDGRPTVLIRPGRAGIDPRELWAFRELLYFFVWRDLKVRYRQTVFGAAWAVIQPFLMMVVFTLFLGRLSGIAPSGIPYPLFVFSGLVPWTLFAQSLVASSDSLVRAADLLQKVYFPRLLLPAAAVGSYLVDLAIGLVVLLLLMAWYGYFPTSSVVWLLPLTILAVSAALSVGIWLSAVNVRYRDVKHAVPFLVQVWLFASPVAYSAGLVPPGWLWLYQLNPMAGVIEGFRWALFDGTAPPFGAVAISALGTVIILVTGIAYFSRVERAFADVI